MGITTNAHLSDAINDFYEKTYLENFFNVHRMYEECVLTDIPLHSGSVVRWNRITNIGGPSELTTVGSPPSATALSTTYVTARLHGFGKLIEISDNLEEDSIQGTFEEAMIQLGESAAEGIDTEIRNVCFKEQEATIEALSAMKCSMHLWASPSNVRTGISLAAGSGTFGEFGYNAGICGLPRYVASSFPAIGAPSAFDTLDTEYPVRITDLRSAVGILKTKNIKPKADGFFHFLCDSTVAANLMNQDAWQTWNSYTREGQLKGERGEFGTIGQAKLIESNNMFASTIGITGTPSYTFRYSILLGKGAIGVSRHGGTGQEKQGYEICKVGRKPDKADPLGQYSTAGYKMRFAAKVLNASAGLILISYQ